MSWLAELLPLFFIRWYAHLYIQRQRYECGDRDTVVMHVRPGVFVELRMCRCPLCKQMLDHETSPNGSPPAS